MFWTQARPGTGTLTAVLGGLALAAGVPLIVWSRSPYDRYLDHGSIGDLPVSASVAAAVFVAGWTLMVTAMMLPTAYPVFALFRGVVRGRDDRWLLMLCIVGYLAVWVAFGAVAYAADLGLHALLEQAVWVEEQPGGVSAAVLLLAGAYQFSPLKYQCLKQCRTPRAFVLRHWTGSHARRSALALGVDSGAFCVGCCWSLMLLMFAVGAGSIPWMLVLATVMAVEKNVSWGHRISHPLGAALLLAAALTAAQGVERV